MREQVKLLEHHADVFPNLVDIAVFICQIIIVNNHSACCCFFQLIQAAQKCGFAGTGRTNQADNLPFLDLQIDSLQNLKAAEILFQLFCFHFNQFDSLLSMILKIFVRTITTT